MIIPANEIPEDTLLRIAEEYVSREGTDYGAVEYSQEEKVQQLLQKIRRKEVLVTFDDATESVNLVSAHDLEELARLQNKQSDGEGL